MGRARRSPSWRRPISSRCSRSIRRPNSCSSAPAPRLAFPPRALREALEARGIGLEAMDSRAAARTWGLLRGEERWIAAALMPL